MKPSTPHFVTLKADPEELECAFKIHEHLMAQLIKRPSRTLTRHVRHLQLIIEELERDINLSKITDTTGKPLCLWLDDRCDN